jgi:hypothetical protein
MTSEVLPRGVETETDGDWPSDVGGRQRNRVDARGKESPIGEQIKVSGEGSSSAIWEQLEPFVRAKIQELIQQVLEAEVAEYLGRERYERPEDGQVGYMCNRP